MNVEEENAMLLKPLVDFIEVFHKMGKFTADPTHIKIDFWVARDDKDPRSVTFYFDDLGIFMSDGKWHSEESKECYNCKKIVENKNNMIRRQVANDKPLYFCSDVCLNNYEAELKKMCQL